MKIAKRVLIGERNRRPSIVEVVRLMRSENGQKSER